MSSELTDIKDFLKAIMPFESLPEEVNSRLVKTIKICYVREGERLPPEGIEKPSLYIVRKGSLNSFKTELGRTKELVDKCGESDFCSLFIAENNPEYLVIAAEDSLIYAIDFEKLKQATDEYPYVCDFISGSATQRLAQKISQLNEQAIVSSSLMNTAISDFYSSPAVTIDETETIQLAAQKMTEFNFSCLLVVKNDCLTGIITDKDFRRRCIAEGLPLSSPVSDIMTENIKMIDVNSYAYDALIKMSTAGVHHLPVSRNGMLDGMVTITDLMKQEGLNTVNMSAMIRKAHTVEELSEISKLLPKLQISMVKLGTTAANIGKSISAITNAFTHKLITLAKEQIGEEPVPFAWVSAGSQARQEQTVHSDQDNGIIIDDSVQPEHQAWFEQLAEFVCGGLNHCGYVYCPGNVMATNDKWRQPQSVWHHYFEHWVDQPEPLALMHSSIFFDLNTVYGPSSLLDQVREKLLKKTKKNTLFLAHLSSNAIKLKPPLGFFRNFVLTASEKHKNTLDLKHNGIAPITDLARIYALSEGISDINTLERLKRASDTPSLSKDAAVSLISAFEFLTMLKVEHQAQQLLHGESANNFLEPKALSSLDREHLKDTFKVIKEMQSVRQTTYG
ncbi:cyclic nucleotide-binding/CBS domain-containing protein [Parashewanella spongiae]|uniref:Cyclic nucleotide-binding/CBS domain-containing protein n=1 Tax=Parashewanella spongiae TaxID=342950 RepID=A0A3A6TQJ8_9GAMM|nr:DUF294 nucleotidyltransferase-like domain-containing protein [Parashewanella spongiae]MCL1079312.1 DUF294 nucleotidyltransferase-like domain-containing protein [Parashewanella spongiae]RJY10519.1 cyclic nucleotide-binding/CBS domain-containing protein [Parashewanella spongiae]